MAIHRQHVPHKDATVVARLKQAGAVILGKLQMTEGAYGLHHPTIEPPGEPLERRLLDGRFVVGGSGRGDRGGPVLRLIGFDTGGSIRFPST